jgi:hypothetical protein
VHGELANCGKALQYSVILKRQAGAEVWKIKMRAELRRIVVCGVVNNCSRGGVTSS